MELCRHYDREKGCTYREGSSWAIDLYDIRTLPCERSTVYRCQLTEALREGRNPTASSRLPDKMFLIAVDRQGI